MKTRCREIHLFLLVALVIPLVGCDVFGPVQTPNRKPTVSISKPSPNNTITTTTIDVEGIADDPDDNLALVNVWIGESPTLTVSTNQFNANGSWLVVLDVTPLTNGSYHLVVQSKDDKGEKSTTASVTFTLQKPLTDAQVVAADKLSLEIGYASGDSASHVTQNLSLSPTGANGTTINWASDQSNFISSTGVVTRPAVTTSVTLTATVSKGNSSDTKLFSVSVIMSDAGAVATDKAALQILYSAGDAQTSVTGNLGFPTSGSNGSTITWVSSSPSIVSTTGVVTRPASTTDVTLTATISKGTASDTKVFTVSVILTSQTDVQAVADDKAVLQITYVSGDSASNVTQNIGLATTGPSGTTIAWVSSNSGVVSNSGIVTRPASTTNVTLTATIVKGSAIDTKTFTVTVVFSDVRAVADAKAALQITYASGDSASSVTQNLGLPTTGQNGTTVAWSSSNPSIVTSTGVVVRPAITTTVTLTASITKGSATDIKTFDLTVISTDTAAVAVDKAALQITYAAGDSASSITQNIGLATTGPSGTSITWLSSNTSIVSNAGLVTRPTVTTNVTLTATITKGSTIDTKQFNVTVMMSVSSTSIDLVTVTGGTFQMGSTIGGVDEKPVHPVTLSAFMVGRYEVTQAQYQAVMGSNPSSVTGDTSHPVETVTWYNAVAFCNALSAREGLAQVYTINGTTVTADWTRNGYRLPTEAEWEFAARGGTLSQSYTYPGSNDVNSVAWYIANAGSTTHPVGAKAPNELGLYDMSGNVWEWCWDWYGSYSSGGQTNPIGPDSGTYRVMRGGSLGNPAERMRSTARDIGTPSTPGYTGGFRVVRRDESSGWTPLGIVGLSAAQADIFSLILDSNGTPYIAYSDYANSMKGTVMKYDGNMWSAVGNPGFTPSEARDDDLVIGIDNRPYFIFLDQTHSAKTTAMMYNGTSWVFVGSAGFTPDEGHDNHLATDSNGTLYYAQSDRSVGFRATVMKYNGSSWSVLGNSGFSAGQAVGISLVIDSSDVPYISYMDYGNSYKATVMKYNGTNWVNVGSAGFSAGNAEYPSLAVSSTGTPYVAYPDGANGNRATVMKYDGTNWVSVGSPGFSAGSIGGRPSLAVDSLGTPYLAYRDGANSNKATIVRYDGTNWVSVGSEGFSAGSADWIHLAIDSTGTLYVAYSDGANNSKATVMRYQ
jgi:formylglycine-generating enzyme required for sulfatase activity